MAEDIRYMTGGLLHQWDYTKKENIFCPVAEVEVLAETEKSITIADYGSPRYCYHKWQRFHEFHKTFVDAKAYLIERAIDKVKASEANLELALEELEACKNIDQSSIRPRRTK